MNDLGMPTYALTETTEDALAVALLRESDESESFPDTEELLVAEDHHGYFM
jgi:hypothetical protein